MDMNRESKINNETKSSENPLLDPIELNMGQFNEMMVESQKTPTKSRIPVSNSPTRSPTPSDSSREVNKRLTSLEKEQTVRLRQLIIQCETKQTEVNNLKNKIMSLKTSKANYEFENFKLEDQVHKVAVNIQIKQDEIDEISAHEAESLRELDRSYQLQVKQMKMDHDSKVYELERSSSQEIEGLLNQKVSEYQKEKTTIQQRIDDLTSKINENEADLNKKLIRIKEEHHRKLLRSEDDSKTSLGDLRADIDNLTRQFDLRSTELKQVNSEIAKSDTIHTELQRKLTQNETESNYFQLEINQLRASIDEFTALLKSKRNHYEHLKQNVQDSDSQTKDIARSLIKEETIRRRLHNQLQELKGNIRVFCRIRPPLISENQSLIDMELDDDDFNEDSNQEIILKNANTYNSTGASTMNTFNFKFDKIFGMSSTNDEIFEEISQLVQSALDGYNVCVFAYGQTGSGKTYTMSSTNGIIPKTMEKIFETSNELKPKGWRFEFSGEFLEIYKESIVDLLAGSTGTNDIKHEIKHDPITMKTTVTDMTSIKLANIEHMHLVLQKALNRRTIAATKANERSSRSHTISTIRISGVNERTGERREGVLNLIDLAGSERLANSQATGERLKETQAINKSLSCLGDVIYALGQSNKESKHIPYRNSKLTYLLQNSLGGNSKTLMFVNVSPFKTHFNETVNSLRFATKVNNTKLENKGTESSNGSRL